VINFAPVKGPTAMTEASSAHAHDDDDDDYNDYFGDDYSNPRINHVEEKDEFGHGMLLSESDKLEENFGKRKSRKEETHSHGGYTSYENTECSTISHQHI
jgi:hypothetical protein